MMQPRIGENHPWAVHPDDQINPNQRWRNPRQRFFFAQNLKGGDVIPTSPFLSPLSGGASPFPG